MPSLSHYFIPHRKNNYRAHFLKPVAFNLAIVGLLLIQTSFTAVKHLNPSVLGISYSITPADIIAQTNDQRGKLGLPALSYNGQLTQAAQAKGQDMLAKQYWAHVSPEGKEPWFFIVGTGYQYNRAGENLAKDFRDSISVVNAWMDSPGHKANIVNPGYKDIGIAVVSGPFNGYETVIVVQMFGEPLGGSSTVAQANTPAATPKPTVKPAVGRAVSLNLQEVQTAEAENNPATPSAALVADNLPTKELYQPVENQATVNPNQILRAVAIGLGIFFVSLLLIDGYIITKNRIARTHHGHSVLHAFLLGILIIGLLLAGTGSIV